MSSREKIEELDDAICDLIQQMGLQEYRGRVHWPSLKIYADRALKLVRELAEPVSDERRAHSAALARTTLRAGLDAPEQEGT